MGKPFHWTVFKWCTLCLLKNKTIPCRLPENSKPLESAHTWKVLVFTKPRKNRQLLLQHFRIVQIYLIVTLVLNYLPVIFASFNSNFKTLELLVHFYPVLPSLCPTSWINLFRRLVTKDSSWYRLVRCWEGSMNRQWKWWLKLSLNYHRKLYGNLSWRVRRRRKSRLMMISKQNPFSSPEPLVLLSRLGLYTKNKWLWRYMTWLARILQRGSN